MRLPHRAALPQGPGEDQAPDLLPRPVLGGPAARSAPARLPAKAEERLRRLDLVREARFFAAECARRGIDLLVLKGPVLAVIAHGAPDARPFTDVDLLVRIRDFPALHQILTARGFTAHRDPSRHLIENLEAFAPFLATDLDYSISGKGLFADIHLALAHADMKPVLDEPLVWDRAETIDLAGVPVRTPGPVDHVIYLALHGLKHAWCSSYLVTDFARYVGARATAEVWRQVVEEAKARGCLRMVLVAIEMTRLGPGIEVPDFVVEALGRDARAREVAGALHRELDTRAGERRGLRATLMRRHAWDTFSGRARWLGRLLFTPNIHDLEFAHLSPRMGPLYFVIRPVRLACFWMVRRGR